MIFTSWVYAGLLVLSVLLYWLVPTVWRRWILLATGALFYAHSSLPYLGLIIGLGAITYVTAWWLQRLGSEPAQAKLRKGIFALGILLNAGLLSYFKYTRLILGTYNDLAHAWRGQPVHIPSILIPLGISFFVFEFIHFLTEVYLGKVEHMGKLDYAVFTLFFPSLVAGPIKRWQPFAEQSSRLAPFDTSMFAEGAERIIWGLGKKILIADLVGRLAEPLADPSVHSRGAIWLAMYAYAIKIYADFSGYSDIAIGSALLFGYRLPENFNWPYLRRNISLFWRDWHISLSSWIRDYLFIPMGGSRVGAARTLFNLAFMMAVSGLWHGAGWNFVLWGLWHGFGLVVLNLWRKFVVPRWREPQHPWGQRGIALLSTLVTFQFVCFGWVLFAAPDASSAFYSFWRMLRG